MMRSCFVSCKYLLILFLLSILGPQQALGSKFSNQFIEFELPQQWKCSLEGTEWVCMSQAEDKKKDAIIVLAAKLKGEKDNLEEYKNYLKDPRSFKAMNGTDLKSDPKYVRDLTVNQQNWADALHLESELPGFYTRYLATVKDDIAVLVSYSIQKLKYNEYQTTFDELVRSLRVFRKQGGVNQGAQGSLFQGSSSTLAGSASLFQEPENTHAGDQNPNGDLGEKKKKKDSSNDDMFYILAIAGVVIAALFLRKKKS